MKKSFRIFALSVSSVYIIPLSERGGTDVVEFGLIKLLSVVHQSLGESVGEESLAAMVS